MGGDGDEVRLQHPLGITEHEGILYLADSYSNKIKRLDLSGRSGKQEASKPSSRPERLRGRRRNYRRA